MTAVFTHATLDRPGPLASDMRPKDRTAAAEAFGFGDLLDVINPLQHIPVVSTLYREITGDTIRPAARVLGGTLFAGPLGAVASIADVAVEQVTGRDTGAHALAALGIGGGEPPAMVAEAAVPPAPELPVPVSMAAPTPVPAENMPRVAAAPSKPVEMASLPEKPAEPSPAAAAGRQPADTAPVAPGRLASVDAAAKFPGNQIPRELLEALYDMHRMQYQAVSAGTPTDRLF